MDTSDLGITKTRSTPQDWANQARGDGRGASRHLSPFKCGPVAAVRCTSTSILAPELKFKGVFEAAARCFERAGDAARAQASRSRRAGVALQSLPLRLRLQDLQRES